MGEEEDEGARVEEKVNERVRCEVVGEDMNEGAYVSSSTEKGPSLSI
jgi:hypothetical protein